ncbi:MAG: response regulator [Bacteroidota bacterium]
MKPKGSFILIDDDKEEHDLFKHVLKKLCTNEVKSAYDGEDGLSLIKSNKTNIFMVISDINMPRMNGLQLKRVIEGTPELKLRSIPFVFKPAIVTPFSSERLLRWAYRDLSINPGI